MKPIANFCMIFPQLQETDKPKEAYTKFLCDFSSVYEEAFPKLGIKIKQKNIISPCITKGILKSSKQK